MEHESDGDINYKLRTRLSHLRIGRETREHGT